MTQEQYEKNQNMLVAARKEILNLGSASLSHQLLQFRLNPSDPAFPLAYKRLDKSTLAKVAGSL